MNGPEPIIEEELELVVSTKEPSSTWNWNQYRYDEIQFIIKRTQKTLF